MAYYALGIDIGTTSVKTLLLSSDGHIADEESAQHDLISMHVGWAEENAADWWNNTLKTVREIIKRNPDKLRRIASIGVSGMVPAIVMLDKDGKVQRNTIQQNDARAIDQIARVKGALDQDVLFRRTGGKTNQQHVIPRLLWVKENEPQVWERTDCVLGSYDYIVFMLTGARSIEVNWAVESGMYDIRAGEWIAPYLEEFDISPALFPAVSPSMSFVGKVSREASAATGLPAGIPVIAGSADHVASTLAAGIVDEGDLLIKFGGAGDILYCVRDLYINERLFFDYHIVPDRYLLNGCMAASGSLVKWFTNDILECSSPDTFKQLDDEAAKVPPASDGLIILPYFIGEKTPIFDPTARGVFFGLTLSHQRPAIFRAILESVIYGFRHHIDVLAESGLSPLHIYATNGGAKSRFWCQIAADILGQTVKSFPSHPGSALGVAFLAGMAAGLFRDWQEIHRFLDHYRVFEPDPRNHEIYNRSYRIYRDLYRRNRDGFADIRRLYS